MHVILQNERKVSIPGGGSLLYSKDKKKKRTRKKTALVKVANFVAVVNLMLSS